MTTQYQARVYYIFWIPRIYCHVAPVSGSDCFASCVTIWSVTLFDHGRNQSHEILSWWRFETKCGAPLFHHVLCKIRENHAESRRISFFFSPRGSASTSGLNRHHQHRSRPMAFRCTTLIAWWTTLNATCRGDVSKGIHFTFNGICHISYYVYVVIVMITTSITIINIVNIMNIVY